MNKELNKCCESCIETKCGGHAIKERCSCPCHSPVLEEEKKCEHCGGTNIITSLCYRCGHYLRGYIFNFVYPSVPPISL